MTDPVNSEASNANTTITRNADQAAAGLANREAPKQQFQPAVGAAPTPKNPGRSTLITNPEPAKEDEPEKAPESLPSTTIAEMAAGRAALEKNKPVAEALEDANRQRAEGKTATASNPVDATPKV